MRWAKFDKVGILSINDNTDRSKHKTSLTKKKSFAVVHDVSLPIEK